MKTKGTKEKEKENEVEAKERVRKKGKRYLSFENPVEGIEDLAIVLSRIVSPETSKERI